MPAKKKTSRGSKSPPKNRPKCSKSPKSACQFEGRCLRCDETVTAKNGYLRTTKNNRKMAYGKCPNCNATVCRFMKND